MYMLKLFLQGGWVMWPILACSLVALAIIIERSVFYIRTRGLYDEDILEKSEANLTLLGVIASISTLLGLFGTVLGMIEVFQKLAAIGGRADVALLSSGVWTALLTTAFGLIVAIPSQAAHELFWRVVDKREEKLTRRRGGAELL
jgi:biopolymer transport protein ExbB